MEVDLLLGVSRPGRCTRPREISQEWRREKISQSSASALSSEESDQIHRDEHNLALHLACSFMLDHVDKVFTWMIYTHVLNKPGIGVKSPLD